MADWLGSYPQFRLNFEQQGKRAKELLKAARAGEPEALARFKSSPRLAEAQYLIAQELRFDNWAALKRHIAAMTREREAAQAQVALTSDAPSLLDGELRTLHIRCGSDIEAPLQDAGALALTTEPHIVVVDLALRGADRLISWPRRGSTGT